jgi:hypothetical protein
MKDTNNVTNQNKHIIKRDFIINGTLIHIKSIFNGHTTLDKAVKNIILRKLSETKNLKTTSLH